MQEKDSVVVPICFVSRVTEDYEKKYGITKLEFDSIIFCVTILRYYLLGSIFFIKTDHFSLVNIMSNRLLNNRIHMGSLLLQEYDFEIKYISCKNNIIDNSLN